MIQNPADEVLIALRQPDSHQGGKWEFPGGKVNSGEDIRTALGRELKEELNLHLQAAHPLIKVHHHYPDKSVLLDVWTVSGFKGNLTGREGQRIKWVPISMLHQHVFPAANKPIVDTLRLPREIAITPQAGSRDELQTVLYCLVQNGVPAIQLRQKQLSTADYADWFETAAEICRTNKVLLFANASPARCRELDTSAVHLTSQLLMRQSRRPVGDEVLLSAACHNLEQLQHAEALGVDLAILSPVAITAKLSRTEAVLGWEKFMSLSDQVSLPVYALGGLKRSDMAVARDHGAHGLAGIRAFQQY